MKYILSLFFLASCKFVTEKAIEDFIEGEAEVAIKIVEDLSEPNPTNPPH